MSMTLLNVLALTFTLTTVACDSDNSSPTTMTDIEVIGEPGDGGVSEGGTEGGGGMTGPTETFLTYTRVYTEPGVPTRGDLIAFNVVRQQESWLNQGIDKADMDCVSRGCQLHPTLNWVAWLQPNMSQNNLYLAPITRADQRVDIANKRLVAENVLRFDFTDTRIVYTEIKESEAANGVAVKVESIDGSESAREVDLVSANGGFATTLSDDLLIIVKTTLSSMNISFLNIDNGQIFELFTFGEEGGTGSEFSASINPVRFAPDSSYLVIVTSNQFMWRANTLEATDEIVTPVSRDLFPIRNVPEACSGDYSYTNVINEPVFTQDSEHFYLLFNGDCTMREYPDATNRQDYDIYRFSRDLNTPPVNVTQVPKGNHWSNHDIRSFAISPDESQVAFTSTRPNRNGTSSIWVMNLGDDGAGTEFDCSRNEELRDINSDVRCEYIFYELDGTVEYRNLKYFSAARF
jgi:hypothetical protein